MAAAAINVGCEGKSRYLTWEAGKKALSRGRFKALNGSRMNIYRCRHCQFWHVGRSA